MNLASLIKPTLIVRHSQVCVIEITCLVSHGVNVSEYGPEKLRIGTLFTQFPESQYRSRR